MANTLTRFFQHPLRTIARAWHKIVVAPKQYAIGDDYDAARYWDDRFRKHGPSLASVGHEGLTESEIQDSYAAQASIVFDMLDRSGIDLSKSTLLEVGCGNGYYSNQLYSRGLKQYAGLDITDAFFPMLEEQYPGFRYICGDITADHLPDKFNVVLMIDVIEHIVTAEKLASALSNISAMTEKDGLLIIAPIVSRGLRSLFYVRFWTEKDIALLLPGFQTLERRGRTLLLKKYAQ